MQPEDVKIGIIGAGVVGGALGDWFELQGVAVSAYDPPKGLDDISAISDADIVFVCVPTPYTPGLGFDDGFLLKAVRCIESEKLVVIKSTVLPGTTELLAERFSQHRFMFNPEFLREATAVEDMMRPDRQIIGCTQQSRREAELVMELLPRAPFSLICSAREAEMAKYVANSFLAVKVSFCNEIYDLCDALGVQYGAVRDIVAADVRIGASHMDVFDGGYRGYAGKCLPKDSKALLDLARGAGLELRVLGATDAVNAALAGEQPAPAVPAPRELRVVPSAAALDEDIEFVDERAA